MDKVSIILPVYNVEKYIEKCLESVCNQTYSNIEIIVVIDGATDKSAEIAKKYIEKDSRVIIIEQENAGSGPARNNGLNHANGKYVMFVDPDDWIEAEMLEKLMIEVKKYDVDFLTTGASNDYYDKEGNLIKTELDHFEKLYTEDVDLIHNKYVDLLLEGAAGAPTKKIYKMDIIKKNNICFPDLRRSQDIVFNYRYYSFIESLIVYDSNYYHYRIEESSFNKKVSNEYFKTVCLIYSDIENLLKNWGVVLEPKKEEEFAQYFYNSIIYQISLGKSASVMKDIVNNNVILEIVSKTNPKGIKQKILKKLILRKKYKLINIIISIVKRKRK